MYKISQFFLFTCGIFFIFLGVLLSLLMYSPSKANMVNTYFPKVEAKINFYQDKNKTQNYTLSGSSFWASKEYYNQSFDTVTVTFGNESTPPPSKVTEVIQYISRDSH